MIACTVCASHGVFMRVVALGPRGDVLAHDDGAFGALYPHAPAPYQAAPVGAPEVPSIYRVPPLVLVVFRGIHEVVRSITGMAGKGGLN